jgi:ElaB/YqjD/DUF883 family membrane-anchored ribosome-binding protein
MQDNTNVRDIAGKELREVLASTEALLSALGNESSDSVNELRDRLTKTVADVKKELGSSFMANARETYHQVRDTAATVNRFTRQRPWSAVTIGIGIGVLIGLLVGD